VGVGPDEPPHPTRIPARKTTKAQPLLALWLIIQKVLSNVAQDGLKQQQRHECTVPRPVLDGNNLCHQKYTGGELQRGFPFAEKGVRPQFFRRSKLSGHRRQPDRALS
jgi:hypothetical protein